MDSAHGGDEGGSHRSIAVNHYWRAGANPNLAGKSGWTALILAAIEGNLSIVESLLSHGAEVDQRDSEGATALLAAAENGHDEIVRILVGSGADVNGKDTRIGWTPLMAASLRGHLATVRLLLASGANINDRDGGGKSALDLAKMGRHLEIQRSSGIRRRESLTPPVAMMKPHVREDLQRPLDIPQPHLHQERRQGHDTARQRTANPQG